jgi:ubiquitin carboxyl-terminal hydrolase 2/21
MMPKRKISTAKHSLENGKTSTQFGCGLVGLRNLGNTCFMNSILQCLCKTKLLREYFFKRHYQNDLNEDHAPTKGRLAKAFGQLMLDMWSKKEEEYITPSQLKAEVQKYAVRFSGYHQQDAQEFLRFFIEGVHDDLNSVRRKPVYSSLDDANMKDGKKSEMYWDRYISREKSMIQDLFVGQLKSTLTCTVCEHRSVTYDPFWDLSLPIPSRSKTEEVNITRCFRAFTQEEILDGDEKPTCEKCKKRRKCTKRFQIEIFPKILVIHLKRFSGTRYRTKLDTKVSFPFDLNLTEFAADSSGSRKQNPSYSLYGVSNHMGGTHGGHYTAYCKHPDTDRWHGYNDSRVSEISSSKTVSSSAYVLFYELCSNGSSSS